MFTLVLDSSVNPPLGWLYIKIPGPKHSSMDLTFELKLDNWTELRRMCFWVRIDEIW